MWRELADRWRALRSDVERLKQRDPAGYVHAPATKMLAMLAVLMLREIPADPNANEYRQGHALGRKLGHWRRAKFFGRFRLFFRFHSRRRAIVYVWLNDENTLRKAGARTDPYTVFARMLAAGTPPDDFDDLLRASGPLRGEAKDR
jgi:toxin YhaV